MRMQDMNYTLIVKKKFLRTHLLGSEKNSKTLQNLELLILKSKEQAIFPTKNLSIKRT